MLGEGLDIRWEHGLADVRTEGESNTLEFRGGQKLQSAIVIGADGPHSQVRKSISPTTEFNVLPYAVYNGKRRMKHEVFDEKYAPFMNGANVIEQKEGHKLMQITVNDRNANNVSISYTYSRPAEKPDPIFNPERPVSGATDIPDALFDEIAELKNLEGPFKDVFDVDNMQNDRLLNWLMRSVFVKGPELLEAARRGVVVIGDSVHAGPILGGYGANAAVKDGVEIAEQIIANGTEGLLKFYEPRYESWRKYVDMSERQLAEMHGKVQPNL